MKKGVFWSLLLFLAAVAGAATALAIYFHNKVKYLEEDLEYDEDYFDEFDDDEENWDEETNSVGDWANLSEDPKEEQ